MASSIVIPWLYHLPIDTLSVISKFLEPRDVVRWRDCSKAHLIWSWNVLTQETLWTSFSFVEMPKVYC